MIIAGVDEVGRGPLAGPVVTAAVILPEHFELPRLTDSKKLTKARRETLYDQICVQAVCFAFGEASREEIDRLNILYATLLAMRRAITNLSLKPDHVKIDGNRLPDLPISAEAIVGGDGLVAEISAASILAKVSRDRHMKKLSEKYPYYGWETNSGYPTKQHIQALEQHGVTPHHRRSFAPVKKLL